MSFSWKGFLFGKNERGRKRTLHAEQMYYIDKVKYIWREYIKDVRDQGQLVSLGKLFSIFLISRPTSKFIKLQVKLTHFKE